MLGNIREPRVMPSHQKKELDGSNTGRFGTMATKKVQATLSREAYQRGGQLGMCRPVFRCFSMGYIVPPYRFGTWDEWSRPFAREDKSSY